VQYATAFLAFVICAGTVNAYVASLAQLGYALSRDRAFPAWLHHRHPRTGTPSRVVWLVVLFACAGVAFSGLFHVHFSQLLFIPNALGMVVYVLSMAAAVKLFKRYSLPWLGGFASLVMLCLFVPFLGIRFLLPILVAVVYMFYKRKRMVEKIEALRNETGEGDGHANAT
jgi:amino acid efflux transporter